MKKILILLILILTVKSSFAFGLALKWSSFFGGSLNDEITKVKTDEFGNTYIVGYTESDDYPTTPNAFQKGKRGNYDVFLTKFDKNQNIIWSTYLGGSSREISQNFFVSNNAIWVVGETISSDYPTTQGALSGNFYGGSGDIIVAKFSLDGDLLYSSYFGGSGYDYAADVTVDGVNNVWITGRTNSSDFYVTNDANKKSITGAYDSYILKLSSSGELIYSSLLGGSLSDYGLSINYSKRLNQVVVVGFTDSDDYPIAGNSIQSNKIGTQDEYDGFVSFFNLNTNLAWSSYMGGFGNDFPLNTAFDSDGNLILRFYTTSYNLPVSINAFQDELKGNINNYIVKISANKNIIWATYLGGSLTDGADNILHKFGGLTVDKENNVLITGFTDSKDFPTTKNSFSKTKSAVEDCYISKFNKDGGLVYSTFLGGLNNDEGRSIATDDDRIIVTGWTVSYDFPTTNNAYSKKIIGDKDGFITIFQIPQTLCDPVMNSEVGFTNLSLRTNRTISNDSYVNLTDFKSFDNGYVFSNDRINVSYGFVSNFSFTVSDGVVRIENSDLKSNELQSDNSLPGADGIAFLIAGLIPNNEGESGGGIGYGGILNAIAIELDLYKNDENNDPNGNHIAIQVPNNFKLSPVHNKQNTVLLNQNILEIVPDSSHTYFGRVEYINKTLKVYLDTTENFEKPVAELDNFVISDYILMDSNRVGYLGLTSSTGKSVEVHKLTHWDICSYSSSSIATGITANESNHSLLVYPNPTDDLLNIALPDGKLYKSLQIVISDLLGKIVMKREIANAQNTLQLNVRNFEKGLYNCQIILDNQEVYRTQLIRK